MFHRLAHAFGILLLFVVAAHAQGNFTLNIGAAAVPATTLVKHDDEWRYHLGTNAPQADWKTVLDDGELDPVMWGYGPGGFGYEDGDDNTVLLVMSNLCTTLYVRRNFDIPAGVDTNRSLRLTMDWDDGFIAWIDGVEVARSANAPPGEPPNTAISNPPNHEASRGPSGNPATTYGLGPVGARLSPGTHVLAIMGLNGAPNSTDFSLIADLILAGTTGGAAADGYFALVRTNIITLSGSNTLATAARVTVNGFPVVYDSIAGTWSRVQTLQPGMNRLFIASLDTQGHILGSISKDIVSEVSPVSIGGSIAFNTTWSGNVRVTNELLVLSGATLTVNPGTVVLLTPNGAVRAATNGTVDVAGSLDQPVFFLPADANTPWREVGCIGPASQLRLRHAEIVAAQVRVQNGDALDFDGTLIGTVLRRCTFRHGLGGNIDAVDVGNDGSRFSFGTVIEDCLMYNFPNDKGVSIGDGSQGTIVRNCLIYGCDSGIAVKDSCTALVYQNTIVNNGFGYKNFNKQNPASPTGGGHITNGWNNIVWNNVTNVSLLNGSTMTNDHSNLGTNYPGIGNINADPLFVNAALQDYRLSFASPSRGTGRDGADMGARFPVGAPMAPSHPQFQSIQRTDYGTWLRFWADSERTYAIYHGPTVTGPWAELEHIASPARPTLTEVFDPMSPLAVESRFYRLVSP